MARCALAECLGTGLLVMAVVGSGAMAQQLTDDVALQLLCNAAATVGALIGLILMFGPVSGAHFNPAVTLSFSAMRQLEVAKAAMFAAAQVAGGCLGAILANVMFGEPWIELSEKARSSGRLWLSELVATVTLLVLIHSLVRTARTAVVPFAVGAWIGGAYFFTASTSFANPAVTIARTLTNTFAGIKPSSAPMFIAVQLVGAAIAVLLIRFLYPTRPD